MTGREIGLLDIYEQQLRSGADVASMRAEVAALTARVDVQLAHGAKKMDALERDLDELKERVPERCADRLMSLESSRDRNTGRSSALSKLITGVVALASGAIGAEAINVISGSIHR